MLTQGQAGKGNAVLNFGPGKLSMDNSQLPLQLTGEAKQADLILYARLPAQLSGSLSDPTLTFEPGALLRSKGRVIDSLDIDEIRWPLAGVKVTQRGVDGRLQAILNMTWAISCCIWMGWRMIFSLTLAAGSGATGEKGVLHR